MTDINNTLSKEVQNGHCFESHKVELKYKPEKEFKEYKCKHCGSILISENEFEFYCLIVGNVYYDQENIPSCNNCLVRGIIE